MKILVLSRKRIFILSIFILITFILFLFIITPLPEMFTNIEHEKNIIVIDPGHGGIDGGASVDGILEKDINLLISLKLKERLEEEGYIAVLTRESDVSLDNRSNNTGSRHESDLKSRVSIINKSKAIIFLSIHANCFLKSPDSNSAIVFYNSMQEKSKFLAECIQDKLNHISFNGVMRRAHEPKTGNYYLLAYSNIPGVIIETGFLSNSLDRKLLSNEGFRDEVASAITEAVKQYSITFGYHKPRYA